LPKKTSGIEFEKIIKVKMKLMHLRTIVDSDEQNAGIENEVYSIRDKKQTQVHSKASLEQNVQNLP
jgi:hypothetical protein